MSVQLIITEDGSHTLYIPELNETYHSRFGARNESMHVFIHSGLHEAMQSKKEISILEMGFGTGLNALLTYKEARQNNLIVSYTTIESNPLSYEIISQLNYLQTEDEYYPFFNQLHQLSWNEEHIIDKYFRFMKLKGSIKEINFPENSFDVIYYDAFGPDVQPGLWTVDVFEKLYNTSNPNAILVTYSCKGDVKRALKTVGFTVKKIPGPKGKREMLRAKKY